MIHASAFERGEPMNTLDVATDQVIFISYSHHDKDWKDRLSKHLGVMEREGLLRVWSDEKIETGRDWLTEIDGALGQTSVAVLLITADFLNSDFIHRREIPDLLERRRNEGVHVFPIIAEPCNWNRVPWLSALQVQPSGRALSAGNEHQINEDLSNIADEIVTLDTEFKRRRDQRGRERVGDVPPPPIRKLLDTGPITTVESRHFAHLELGLQHRRGMTYKLELRCSQSGADSDNFLEQLDVRLDLAQLGALRDRPVEHGKLLGECLFGHDKARRALDRALSIAARFRVCLHLRVRVGPTEQELHDLQWETLYLPGDAGFMLERNNIRFTRYMSSYGENWRSVELLPQSKWKVLAVVALLPHDAPAVEGEYALARRAFGEASLTPFHTIAEPTFANLSRHLVESGGIYDAIYLAGEVQVRDGVSQVVFPDDKGTRTPVSEGLLAAMFRELPRKPRLVVLAPWSSGAGADEREEPTQLAPLLATNGVGSVLAAQSHVSADTWERYTTRFLRGLQKHGYADRAQADALRDVRDCADRFGPVVFSRMRTARVAYNPGFLDDAEQDRTLRGLATTIRDGRCTPILGPGASWHLHRFRREVAYSWAEEYHYPLAIHDRANLNHVAQFIRFSSGAVELNDRFGRSIRDHVTRRYAKYLPPDHEEVPLDELVSAVGRHVRNEDPQEVHAQLAALPLPVYITTHFSGLMTDALRDAGKEPKELVFSLGESREEGKNFRPDKDHPLVYHLFGRLYELGSLLLTEDDYFDFLRAFALEKARVPKVVRSALAGTSLMFLGFTMTHLDFRVLFHSIKALEGREQRQKLPHVAVQIDPDDDLVSDPARARQFLQTYFADAKISIFWGSAQDFLKTLRERLA